MRRGRMATALRLGATPDAGPRSTGALLKGNDGYVCEQPLAINPFHSFVASSGEPGPDHTAQSCARLHRLIQRAGGYADMERHVPELHGWVKNENETAPEVRCAILDVVSWFSGVLQQLWIDFAAVNPKVLDLERYDSTWFETRVCSTRIRPM